LLKSETGFDLHFNQRSILNNLKTQAARHAVWMSARSGMGAIF
jgi:hypothetical protein